MSKYEFTTIPGILGTYESDIELVLSGENIDEVKKLLTIKDNAVAWQLNRIRKTAKRLREQLAEASAMGDSPLESYYSNKLEPVLEEMAELNKNLHREFFFEREDGTLSVPPGFWKLCSIIKDDNHIANIKLAPLPDLGKQPRPYQIEAAEAALKYKRGMIILPTGAGKTLTIAMICNTLVKMGLRVCLIEPTIELVSQTKEALAPYIPNLSGLGGSFKFKKGNDLLISTINSATKYIDLYDAVIIDESQHSAATSYMEAGILAVKAKYFYGLTACPVRADGLTLGIHASCGPIVYEKDSKWGIENGFLSKAKICMVEVGKVGRYKESLNSQKVYKYQMHHPRTLEVVYDLLMRALKEGRKTLIIYKTIQAGLALKEFCEKKGLKFDVANSDFRHPLNQFRKGEVEFLVANSGLLAEGVDIPNIDCIINCVQNSSENLTRQIIGRGLRIFPGKEYLTFFDIYTTGFKQFEGSSYSRRAVYKTMGIDPKFIIR